MKTLLLLRHAKSSWKDAGRADHDRPLNARGKRDAPRMGELLLELDLVPDVVICSTARRARATWKRLAVGLGPAAPDDVHVVDDLYPTSVPRTTALLRAWPDTSQRPLVIGHNPGLEAVIEAATGEQVTMPTAALAAIVFPHARWSDLTWTGDARLDGVWRPKELPAAS